MGISIELLTKYKEELTLGGPVVPMEEQSLYALHKQQLQQLSTLLSSAPDPKAIRELVAAQRQAFGRSFLSGEHGDRIERAFHALASALEEQYA